MLRVGGLGRLERVHRHLRGLQQNKVSTQQTYEYCENYREISLPSLTVADQGPEVRVSARELPRTRALRLRPQERRGPVRRGGGQGLPEGGHVITTLLGPDT